MERGNTMSKLIQKYQANPTHKMLIKIAEYSKKHPFAWVMITQEEAAFIKHELEDKLFFDPKL